MINATDGIKVSNAALCTSLSLTSTALVTRAKSSAEGGLRLKTAAAMAEGGKIRETAEKLWIGGDVDQEKLASKVGSRLSSMIAR